MKIINKRRFTLMNEVHTSNLCMYNLYTERNACFAHIFRISRLAYKRQLTNAS
jgi:hypothetical protein